MKTAVVAGGAGFLGSHLCDLLLARGMRVVCVDNLVTGRVANIAHHQGDPGFTFVQHDICEPLALPGGVDWVLNFASPASPADYLRHPIETMRVGSLGTMNTLELAREKGATYLMASTSEVYGDPLVHPQPEDYWGNVNTVGPRSVYDESKRFSEALVMAYHRTYGLDTRIVRIFNTYGPRMRKGDGRAVPAFITQALAGEPLTVFGDGTQTRSLCYVADLVEGIYRLLQSSEHMPVNLGTSDERTMLELAEMIKKLAGSASPIVFRPAPPDDPRVRRPDLERARRILGWEPVITLEEGLRRTLEYFQTADSSPA